MFLIFRLSWRRPLLLRGGKFSSRRICRHSLRAVQGFKSQVKGYPAWFLKWAPIPKFHNSITGLWGEHAEGQHTQGHLIMLHLRSWYLLWEHTPQFSSYSLNISIAQKKSPFNKMLILNKLWEQWRWTAKRSIFFRRERGGIIFLTMIQPAWGLLVKSCGLRAREAF